MLLTLTKTRKTRYGWCCQVTEKNHQTGDKQLAEVHIRNEDLPLELIYPLHITASGIYIRRARMRWKWKCPKTQKKVEWYLREVQKLREEIYLDVSKKAQTKYGNNNFSR